MMCQDLNPPAIKKTKPFKSLVGKYQLVLMEFVGHDIKNQLAALCVGPNFRQHLFASARGTS